MGFAATCVAIRAMRAQFPRARAILIEDKANGSAVIETLRKELTGVIAINPQGGKVARAYAVQPEHEAGNLHLPDPSIAPWVGEFLDEFSAFPAGVHDDEVDAATQILNWFTSRSLAGGASLIAYYKGLLAEQNAAKAPQAPEPSTAPVDEAARAAQVEAEAERERAETREALRQYQRRNASITPIPRPGLPEGLRVRHGNLFHDD